MSYNKFGAVQALKSDVSHKGSIVQINDLFALQSFFDATPETLTPQGQAVLVQPKNEAIVPSTFKPTQQRGYALGLAPWSETPVAVEFILGPQGKASTIILKPGQIVRPQGVDEFTGFNYGIPTGWLGGGASSLCVFKTREADVKWNGIQSEIIFHRYTTTILEGVGAGIALTPPTYVNLPTRFPWIKNNRFVSGTLSEAQNGQGAISISEVTKMLLRLNYDGDISAGNAASVVFWGTDPFGIGADGLTANSADQYFQDIYFPDNTVVPVGNRSPIVSLSKEFGSIPANQWGFAIYAPAGSPLVGKTVNVVRYGRL